MLRLSILCFSVTLLVGLVVAKSGGSRSFVDLTWAFNNETVLFPGRRYSFNVEFEGFTAGGFWLSSRGFCTSEHTSTHIDAPFHFHKDGRTLDQIPLEDFIDIPGVLIDVYDKVHKYDNGKLIINENYALSKEDILQWEKINGVIPPRSVVLLRTGWAARWPNAAEYQGIKQTPGAPTTTPNPNAPNKIDLTQQLNSPGFDGAAASLLSTERQVLGVGIDTLNVDIGSTQTYPAHQIFAARGTYMIENVANLHLLPPRGFRLWLLPFKIDRGTGAPIRVIASIDTSSNKV